jgi:hypothetical protein
MGFSGITGSTWIYEAVWAEINTSSLREKADITSNIGKWGSAHRNILI